MGARTILTGWVAMVGLRLLELTRQPGHYTIEIDNRGATAPRWRVYALGDQPGRWEQARSTPPKTPAEIPPQC